MRASFDATALLLQEIDDEIGIKEAHSRGMRAGCRCRSFTCASMSSSVCSFKVRDVRARKSVAAVLRCPKCSLRTLENDCPGRLCRAKSSYASRSIVIVLTAIHLPYT